LGQQIGIVQQHTGQIDDYGPKNHRGEKTDEAVLKECGQGFGIFQGVADHKAGEMMKKNWTPLLPYLKRALKQFP